MINFKHTEHEFTIGDNEVHVWNYSLNVSNGILQHCFILLSNTEKQQIKHIKIDSLRSRTISSKFITKYILSRYLGEQVNKVIYSYNKFGKPIILDSINPLNLQFNISHSGDMGIMSIAKGRLLGIDLEKLVRLNDIDNIINLCFSDYEIDKISKLGFPDKTNMFYKIWTAKEAFVKAIGMGFSFPLKNISLTFNDNCEISIKSIEGLPLKTADWHVLNFYPADNYTSTLVVNANAFSIKSFYLSELPSSINSLPN